MTDGTFSDEPPSKVAKLDSLETEREVETDLMALSRVNSAMLTPEAKFTNQGELFDELMCLFSGSIKKDRKLSKEGIQQHNPQVLYHNAHLLPQSV